MVSHPLKQEHIFRDQQLEQSNFRAIHLIIFVIQQIVQLIQ